MTRAVQVTIGAGRYQSMESDRVRSCAAYSRADGGECWREATAIVAAWGMGDDTSRLYLAPRCSEHLLDTLSNISAGGQSAAVLPFPGYRPDGGREE